MNFKEIHIGKMIEMRIAECGIEMSRICKFLKTDEEGIEEMLQSKSMDAKILLRWCKLLEYDFFRIYSQHLIMFSPPSAADKKIKEPETSSLPQFRKNIYTQEIIDFILEQINGQSMTKKQVMEEYGIPKTTLYKWIKKYPKKDE
ncbi:MAG TPA: hypothetical protein VL022_06910 [Moheibacter sp.]|nr:hypothetical protein [Moheibacter sp.]